MLQHAQLLRAQTAHPVCLHKIGDHRVHQHGHMAEHVVEHVGLFQVVELIGAPDELAGRKAALRQVFEKDLVRHQTGHRDDLPAGAWQQHIIQGTKVGDGVRLHRQAAHTVYKGGAGTPWQQRALTLEQRAPDRVLLRAVVGPALVYRPVDAFRLCTCGRPVFHV